ncbi:hypothetical protein JCM21714_4451 [Gracilibacillus boraciitolerans JCM 21714]|uniref:Uncharacterized protein n=1 Tax=Gracilibacillus boraciitolerans JCM 21714 TaxID=1298598 RepID=W4VPY2_9BACI|nr:hypothetical protein [Gracilibacillus boraciitolerans]GAE95236.1 hypothetical protein JCM21714_4451 [Gracilibacillus boraciitolerans JCM 21714]
MRKLTLNSVEFRRIIHNLYIEELDIPVNRQKKLLDFINSGKPITSRALKELFHNG